MNADLEKIAAQFTFSKGTTGGKVVGGKLPTPTKVSGGSGSGGTTPPAKTTTPPANSGSGTGAPAVKPAGGTGGGATPPPQQTPPQQQKQEKQPNPTVEAAKKDAKQVAGKATDWANKNLGGAGEAVANSNLGQQFLNSKTGQNFQKTKVGKWAMNNKGAAVGLAGAGLAAGGLAIGAAIKRHKEKKKMKEQAQMNAQAMGKSALDEAVDYLMEKQASKANAKNFGALGLVLGSSIGSSIGSYHASNKVYKQNKDRLKEIRQELRKGGFTKEEKRALKNERANINRDMYIASLKGQLKGALIGAGIGAGVGAGGGALIGYDYKEPRMKRSREKVPFDGNYYDGEVFNKDGSKAASEGFAMYDNIGAQLEKVAGMKYRVHEMGRKIEKATGFGPNESGNRKMWKGTLKSGVNTERAKELMRDQDKRRLRTGGVAAGVAGAAAGGAIALKKLRDKKKKQKKEALDAAVAHLMEKEAGDGCKCKGKKGKLGNLMTDSTKSDQSADVTGRGGESLLRQKKALDEAVARLLEKA